MKIFDVDRLLSSITGFIETKIELIKLDVEVEMKNAGAKLIVMLLISAAFFFALFLISMAVSNFLNHILDSLYLGYLLMAVIFIIMAIIIYSKRNAIIAKVLLEMSKKTQGEIDYEEEINKEENEA